MTKTLLSTIPTEVLDKMKAETTMEVVDKAEAESVRDGVAFFEIGDEVAAVTYASALMVTAAMFDRLYEESVKAHLDFEYRWAIGLWHISIRNAITKLIVKAYEEDVRTGGNFLKTNPSIAGFIQDQEILKEHVREAVETDLESGKSFLDMFEELYKIIEELAPESEK